METSLPTPIWQGSMLIYWRVYVIPPTRLLLTIINHIITINDYYILTINDYYILGGSTTSYDVMMLLIFHKQIPMISPWVPRPARCARAPATWWTLRTARCELSAGSATGCHGGWGDVFRAPKDDRKVWKSWRKYSGKYIYTHTYIYTYISIYIYVCIYI